VFVARDEAELEPVPGAGLIVVTLQVLTVKEYPAQARLRSLAPAQQPHPSRLSSSVPDPVPDPHAFWPPGSGSTIVRGMHPAQDPDPSIIEQE
jgi:hypothetical protein